MLYVFAAEIRMNRSFAKIFWDLKIPFPLNIDYIHHLTVPTYIKLMLMYSKLMALITLSMIFLEFFVCSRNFTLHETMKLISNKSFLEEFFFHIHGSSQFLGDYEIQYKCRSHPFTKNRQAKNASNYAWHTNFVLWLSQFNNHRMQCTMVKYRLFGSWDEVKTDVVEKWSETRNTQTRWEITISTTTTKKNGQTNCRNPIKRI